MADSPLKNACFRRRLLEHTIRRWRTEGAAEEELFYVELWGLGNLLYWMSVFFLIHSICEQT